ncbi:hypothetical protein ACS0TY_004810 [Phlomoides rotata]
MAPPRAANYCNIEDVHLAKAWLDVSQDPITGNNQSRAKFWERVADEYNRAKPSLKMERNLQRANELLRGQKGYEEGFKYDHVWSILKEYLQTQTETQGVVFSEPEENMMGSPNPSLPPFHC